jgi:CRP/FNR family transcriptional regulator, polysaccharide utilization system transcription regulator
MITILVIEDNEMMADDIASLLELADYKVLTAFDGRAGVAMTKEHRPDLILCDIMMPGLDGYSVLQILSSDQKTAGIPFVFLTAKASQEDHETGLKLGANDYIIKPFDDVYLLDVIRASLKNKNIPRGEIN